ncbi:MAG: ABC transporter substrate-binding protein [Chloroflexi bacterium]|nr:ABC transporter substrate-binding protein [Chloroflexota bacterium]
MARKRHLLKLLCFSVLVPLLLAACAPAAVPAVTAKPAVPAAKAPVAETPASKPAVAPPKLEAPLPTPPSATPKLAVEEPRYGGILAIAAYANPVSYDMIQESVVQSVSPIAPCYSGLVQHDPLDQTKVIGDLAKKWDMSPDGMSYTFYLQENVTWHDGVAFTAEDARFTLDVVRNPPRGVVSTRKEYVAAVQKVEASGKDILKISLQYPSASFLDNLGDGRMVVVPKHVFEAKGNMRRDVVGTGPYKFKSYVPGSSISVVKNSTYFIKGRPYLDGITWYIIPDAATRFAALRTHRVQLTPFNFQGLTPSQSETIRRDKELSDNIAVVKFRAPTGQTLWMNTTKSPWSDLRVRRALDLTVDRQKIIKVAVEGVGEVGSFMPPGQWGLPEAELLNMPGYRLPKDADIAEAKRLLAEAGYSQGLKVPTLSRDAPQIERAATSAKEQLAQIGMDLTIVLKDQGSMYEMLYRRDFDIAFTGASGGLADPDQIFGQNFVPGVPRNFSDYKDEQMSEWYKEQSRAMDPAKRKEIVLNMQRKLHELAPFSVLYWAIYESGFWKEVRHVGDVSVYNNMKFQNVWLAK